MQKVLSFGRSGPSIGFNLEPDSVPVAGIVHGDRDDAEKVGEFPAISFVVCDFNLHDT